MDKHKHKPDLDALRNDIEDITGDTGYFVVKNGNEWIDDAKSRPIPRMLFSEFWYETEVCIMFADTNLGKSILAVQLADSIARGVPIPGFKFEAEAQTVVYFDFELSDKQFERRYSADYTQHYVWHPNFYRAEINTQKKVPDGFRKMEDYINFSIDLTIEKTNAKILIIDNLTYLKNETERAKDALPLMQHLNYLKLKHGLSILALAHTPKRDPSKPLNRNDVQGSKSLMNLCDASFAIGESFTEVGLRYIKQVKQRSTEELYGTNNVVVCHLTKPNNFLKFDYIGTSREREHLREKTREDDKKQLETIMELKEQGLPLREIASRIGISHVTVNKIVKRAMEGE